MTAKFDKFLGQIKDGTSAISDVAGLQPALDGKATTAQGAKADTALQPSAQLTQAAVTAATAAGVALIGAADAAAQRGAMGAMASSLPAMQTAYDAGTTAQKAAFQASVSGDTTAQASSRTLTSVDASDIIVVTSNPTITVPAGLGIKFRCAIYGTVVVAAGAGVTIVDARAAASVAAICVIMSTATPDNYVLIGGVL